MAGAAAARRRRRSPGRLAELTAVADIEKTQVERCLTSLKRVAKSAPRVKVETEKQYLGLDAFQKVIAGGVDVVLLATPPGFRPQHLAACIEAGKHVFCEKPISTDGPGVRSVLATTEKALEKNLNLVSGFCWRYNNMIQETFQKMEEGAIGKPPAVAA